MEEKQTLRIFYWTFYDYFQKIFDCDLISMLKNITSIYCQFIKDGACKYYYYTFEGNVFLKKCFKIIEICFNIIEIRWLMEATYRKSLKFQILKQKLLPFSHNAKKVISCVLYSVKTDDLLPKQIK